MLQIDIDIPRPWLTLSIVAATVMFVWQGVDSVPADATGGSGETEAMTVHEAEEDVKKLREKQDVLDRREEILRADLAALEEELERTQSQQIAAQLVAAREELLALLEDRREAESQILISLQQIWEAQGVAVTASRLMDGEIAPAFDWPVEPTLGISAGFHDEAYHKRFGMEHNAVDIPVLQGSTVYAAAAGAVVKVSDNGKGYNSIVISHDGGFSTLYGHVSAFLVKEGDAVRAGQAIALSGGTPGTNGAGRMTTGAHLHFEVIRQGVHVDPLQYLPTRRSK
jgi:murein DD-endopeptidase MepM/ murein hydrolase activator NlpD